MDELTTIREEIDAVDAQILELFCRRMDLACQVADYKRERGLPVLDASREDEKIAAARDAVPEELAAHAASLMSHLMELSRARQAELLGGDGTDGR